MTEMRSSMYSIQLFENMKKKKKFNLMRYNTVKNVRVFLIVGEICYFFIEGTQYKCCSKLNANVNLSSVDVYYTAGVGCQ